MRSAILMCGSSAHEVAKAGASSLSKLALLAGSTAGELWKGRIRLADGGGVNLYWSAGGSI